MKIQEWVGLPASFISSIQDNKDPEAAFEDARTAGEDEEVEFTNKDGSVKERGTFSTAQKATYPVAKQMFGDKGLNTFVMQKIKEEDAANAVKALKGEWAFGCYHKKGDDNETGKNSKATPEYAEGAAKFPKYGSADADGDDSAMTVTTFGAVALAAASLAF